jgi:uncharacterized protein (DUF305 family)
MKKSSASLLYIASGILLFVLVISFYFMYKAEAHTESKKSSHDTHQETSMAATMGGMMSGLNGKTGDDFDKAFLSEMIVHHQGAVDMAQAVLKNSKRPELIKLANDIIKAQTGEIATMQSWQKTWFTK